jgi:hypothetical protein
MEALGCCKAVGGAPVHVDSDKLRVHHPTYAVFARTDPAAAFSASQDSASRWADGLRDAAMAKGLDLVVEGMFKTQANTVSLLDRLVAANYEVHLLVKIIPAPVSLLQIERRYEVQMTGGGREAVPRRVDAAGHDRGYHAVPPLLELFAARNMDAQISLRDIHNTPLARLDGSGVAATGAGTVGDIRSREPSEQEKDFCFAALAEVQRMREARGAPENAEPGSALEAALIAISQWA